MTSTDVQLVVRQPAWARAWAVGFPVALAAAVLSGLPFRGDPGPALRFLFSAFVLLLGWRLFRLAAVGTADGRLVVRNFWRDRTLQRQDIAGVGIGRGASAAARAVRLELHDGSTLRLDVTENQFGRKRLAREADEVRAWVGGRAGLPT